MAQNKIERKDLLTQTITPHTVSKVLVQEIILPPLQQAPLHRHPCPVVGYVAEGNLLFQIEGQPARLLKKGDAFYEPAGTNIIHFDNACKENSLKFIAFYVSNGEGNLIELVKHDIKK